MSIATLSIGGIKGLVDEAGSHNLFLVGKIAAQQNLFVQVEHCDRCLLVGVGGQGLSVTVGWFCKLAIGAVRVSFKLCHLLVSGLELLSCLRGIGLCPSNIPFRSSEDLFCFIRTDSCCVALSSAIFGCSIASAATASCSDAFASAALPKSFASMTCAWSAYGGAWAFLCREQSA